MVLVGQDGNIRIKCHAHPQRHPESYARNSLVFLMPLRTRSRSRHIFDEALSSWHGGRARYPILRV